MESFTDLLTGAFSETSVPSFPDEDLDFENLNFDDKHGDGEAESVSTETDRALFQEATGERNVLFGEEDKGVLWLTEDVHKEVTDVRSDEEYLKAAGDGPMDMDREHTSTDGKSEEESSASEDEEEEEEQQPGDLLMSVCCPGISEKDDRIFAEGQPLALQDAEIPQVSNKVQRETGSDEEVSYFGEIPEKGSEMMTKGAAGEEDGKEIGNEKQELSSDLDSEGIGQDEEFVTQCFTQESTHSYGLDPMKDSSEFPSIALQNLQDLIAEVDSEECVEKMKDFSGEQHQEAGESFADYPSDFSSCEYVEDGGKNHESEGKPDNANGPFDCGSEMQQKMCLDIDAMDKTISIENPDNNEDGRLFRGDLEMDAEKLMSPNAAGSDEDKWKMVVFGVEVSDGEDTGDSDSYSSSDDELKMRRSTEEFLQGIVQKDFEYKSQLEEPPIQPLHSCLGDDPVTNSRVNPTDFVSWDFKMLRKDTPLSECVLTTEDADQTKMASSDVNQSPNEYVNSYSVVMREDNKPISPSYQGSLDDSFFFNTGIEISERQEGSDEYEEERNWEQEHERIKAFFEYYDDSDEENEKEGRQIKVQFSAHPLSQVIHYETDSDADSLSSSTDREEDPSSADTPDELGEDKESFSQQMNPECDPPTVQNDVSHLGNAGIRTRNQRCNSLLKQMLKLVPVMLTGLLMYWLVTDQADWLSQIFFF